MTRQPDLAAKFIAPLDPVELACRLIESAGEFQRPVGQTAAQAFALLDTEDQEIWLRCAHACLHYFKEQIDDAKPRQLRPDSLTPCRPP